MQERRNFGETVRLSSVSYHLSTDANQLHPEDDVLGLLGPDDNRVPGFTALRQVCCLHLFNPPDIDSVIQLATAFSIVLAVTFGLMQLFPERPAVQRSFPYNGLKAELGGKPTRALEDDDVD
jgi:hypothetical protein